MVAPDVQIEDGKGTILISSEEGETEGTRLAPPLRGGCLRRAELALVLSVWCLPSQWQRGTWGVLPGCCLSPQLHIWRLSGVGVLGGCWCASAQIVAFYML